MYLEIIRADERIRPDFLRAEKVEQTLQLNRKKINRTTRGREGMRGKEKKATEKKKRLYRFLKSGERNRFLNYYIELGSISRAAAAACISRQSHYLWLQNDEYRVAFEKARKMAADVLEDEAHRRAVNGYEEKVFYKGKKIGTITRYSDTLLTLLLKGAKPDVYKERVEQTNVGDGAADVRWEEGADDGGAEKTKDSNTVSADKTVAGKNTSES